MVVSIKESAGKRRSTIKNGRATHTFVFVVICDDPHDGTAVAVLADGIPRSGSTLNGDPNTIVATVEANPINGSALHFEVLVEYDSAGFEAIDLYPLDRPPEYSFGGDSFTEAYFLDESQPDKKPFVNTSQDAFEQMWERKKSDLTISITRNVAFWTTFEADDFNDTTNADVIFIDGVGYDVDVLCMGIISAVKTREVWQGLTVEYYRETLSIGVRKAGWLDHPEDRGFNTVKLVTKSVEGVDTLVLVKQPIVDSTGLKITKPWPLSLGQALSSADSIPDVLDFRPYKSVAWQPLALE